MRLARCSFWCDQDDCEAISEPEPDWPTAWETARAAGWVARYVTQKGGNVHLCPLHDPSTPGRPT